MPCARATRMAADPPSTSPKATNDVQETLHPLRQEHRARYALSVCRPDMGRPDRISTRPSTQQELHGLRVAFPLGRVLRRHCLSLPPRHRVTLGSTAPPPRSTVERRVGHRLV